MALRVAVASSDGKFVNQHFGKATKFLIFDIEAEGKFDFVEVRETSPSCVSYQQHDEEELFDTVELLNDSKVVLVSQIGPGASQRVIDAHMIPIMYPGFIQEALNEISQNLDKFL
ncbi:NifB/NifX family molybdenum-iron cluster-binding protein [Methanobacterium movens]